MKAIYNKEYKWPHSGQERRRHDHRPINRVSIYRSVCGHDWGCWILVAPPDGRGERPHSHYVDVDMVYGRRRMPLCPPPQYNTSNIELQNNSIQ